MYSLVVFLLLIVVCVDCSMPAAITPNIFNETHPLIVIGLPKSGTTSLTEFLKMFGIKAAHQFFDMSNCREIWPVPAVSVDNDIKWKRIRYPTHKCFVGELIQLAIGEKKHPLFYVFESGIFAVSQMDACYEVDVWPQIDALTFFMESYPNAYYVHTIRPNVTAHVNSIMHWSDLPKRMRLNGQLSRFPGQSKEKSVLENMEVFVTESTNIVRKRFMSNPDLKYVEIAASEHDSGKKLADFLGIPVADDFKMPHANVGTYGAVKRAVPFGERLGITPRVVKTTKMDRKPSYWSALLNWGQQQSTVE